MIAYSTAVAPRSDEIPTATTSMGSEAPVSASITPSSPIKTTRERESSRERRDSLEVCH